MHTTKIEQTKEESKHPEETPQTAPSKSGIRAKQQQKIGWNWFELYDFQMILKLQLEIQMFCRQIKPIATKDEIASANRINGTIIFVCECYSLKFSHHWKVIVSLMIIRNFLHNVYLRVDPWGALIRLSNSSLELDGTFRNYQACIRSFYMSMRACVV